MLESHTENEQDQKVMEFDFPLPFSERRNSTNLMKRHDKIGMLLGLPEDNSPLQHTFNTVATLCDPFTQPEEGEGTILSLDCLADVLIALSYTFFTEQSTEDEPEALKNPDIRSVKFALSIQFFKLLRCIQLLLNADNEIKLRYVKNSEDDWYQNLPEWTPIESLANDEFALKLCYSMSCVLLFAICKLFKPEDENEEYNLSLNPYLQYFIKLWKCHTNIILLGLEIDRRLEIEQVECPLIVSQTLRGSSSVRYVLAWTLNQNPSLLAFYGFDEADADSAKNLEDANHDIKCESLLSFIQPMSRKKVNGGALLIDMRLVIIALLIINSGISFTANTNILKNLTEIASQRIKNQAEPIAELGDLLIDLEYDDQFDEDIRYIFECEFEDLEDQWLDVADEEEKGKLPEKIVPVNGKDQKEGNDGLPSAVRAKNDIEFDEFGNDWRDLPRGNNAFFESWFLNMADSFEKLPEKEKGQSDDFLYSWDELKESFDFLSTTSIENDSEAEQKIGQVLINTISKAIKDEVESISDENKSTITPDRIYLYFCDMASEEAIQATQNNNKLIVPIFKITNFELLLHNNSKLARCLMDEMLMCNGYRRVLIWFITHYINLSTLLIDYVFELLVAYRGDKTKQAPYKLTRQGNKVELSEVEKLMLLHEFLTNSSIYLSATEGIEIDNGYKVVLSESIAKKHMTLICLMINQLINVGVINLDKTSNNNDSAENEDIHDYSNDLQVLLIQWVGKLPEARELFFKVKKTNYVDGYEHPIESDIPKDSADKPVIDHGHNKKELSELVMKFSKLSGNQIIDDLEQNTSHISTISTFASQLEKHIKTVIAAQLHEVHLISKDMISTDLNQMFNDFNFFLQNFNTFCKIDYFAESLFSKFENLAATGHLKEKTLPLIEEFDSEFNDLFLNGEGKFNTTKDESEGKSKKKNKKKKKKKK